MNLAKTMLGFFLCISVHHQSAEGRTWVVGGDDGWGYNVSPWPLYKEFRHGDVLNFRYDRDFHDVSVVSEADYYKCNSSRHSKMHKTGHDSVSVVKGWNYFISSRVGDCLNGIQMALFAD